MAFIREDSSTAVSVVVTDADGGSERVLATRRVPQVFYSYFWAGAPIARPSWSMDGRLILAIGLSRLPERAGRTNELVVIDATTGSEIKAVPLEKVALLEAAWLDASHVLVNATMPGKLPSVARVDLGTGVIMPITQDLTEFRGVSLTAGHQSAVTTRVDTRSAIWVGDATGAAMSEVVPDSPSRPRSVALDRVGGLVYQAATASGSGIYAIRPGEHAPTLVVDDASDPAVTADGRTIVLRRASGAVGLYRVNIDGSGLKALVDGSAGAQVITPDDQTMLFQSNRSGEQSIWSVPLAGGQPREILHRFVLSGTLRVSPDGRRLLFVAGFADGRQGSVVTMCDLPDCTNPREAKVPLVRLGQWTPDSQGVAYFDRTDSHNIWVQPIDGGAPHPLTTFTDKTISDFAWSPDGKRLAITRSTDLADIVLIKGIR